jgi:hypothetical protein
MDFALWPEHVAAYELFHGCATQWAWDQGVRTGLPADRVRATPAFRALPRARREAVFADMQWIERGFLDRQAERREAERQRAERQRRTGGRR